MVESHVEPKHTSTQLLAIFHSFNIVYYKIDISDAFTLQQHMSKFQ